MRILFPILILAVSGCGTFTAVSVAQKNPNVEPIYGGVRTDINCIFSVPKGDWELVDWIAKPCSIVDLPLSLAADTLMLPYAIWTINHRPSPPKDGKDARPSEQLSAGQTTQTPVAEAAQSTSAPNPMEKAK